MKCRVKSIGLLVLCILGMGGCANSHDPTCPLPKDGVCEPIHQIDARLNQQHSYDEPKSFLMPGWEEAANNRTAQITENESLQIIFVTGALQPAEKATVLRQGE